MFSLFLRAVAVAGVLLPIASTSQAVERNTLDTRFFAGLQWNFGASQPELMLGVRRTETRSNQQVVGGKVDIAIPLLMDFSQIRPLIRLVGLAGNRDIQAEFGFGLQTINWRPVLSTGVQVPYANGGLNYIFGQGLNPFLGLNTLNRPPAPRPVTAPVIISPIPDEE